jgi:hypothetical protein
MREPCLPTWVGDKHPSKRRSVTCGLGEELPLGVVDDDTIPTSGISHYLSDVAHRYLIHDTF